MVITPIGFGFFYGVITLVIYTLIVLILLIISKLYLRKSGKENYFKYVVLTLVMVITLTLTWFWFSHQYQLDRFL